MFSWTGKYEKGQIQRKRKSNVNTEWSKNRSPSNSHESWVRELQKQSLGVKGVCWGNEPRFSMRLRQNIRYPRWKTLHFSNTVHSRVLLIWWRLVLRNCPITILKHACLAEHLGFKLYKLLWIWIYSGAADAKTYFLYDNPKEMDKLKTHCFELTWEMNHYKTLSRKGKLIKFTLMDTPHLKRKTVALWDQLSVINKMHT